MPKRYTFEEVQKIFTDNNCVLQSTSYVNQLCKLEYIASCGHVHTNTLKEVLHP